MGCVCDATSPQIQWFFRDHKAVGLLRQSPLLITSKPLADVPNVQRSAYAGLSIGLADQYLWEVSVCSSCMTTPIYALSASSDGRICHRELSNSDVMHFISTPSLMPCLDSLTIQAKGVHATSKLACHNPCVWAYLVASCCGTCSRV